MCRNYCNAYLNVIIYTTRDCSTACPIPINLICNLRVNSYRALRCKVCVLELPRTNTFICEIIIPHMFQFRDLTIHVINSLFRFRKKQALRFTTLRLYLDGFTLSTNHCVSISHWCLVLTRVP